MKIAYLDCWSGISGDMSLGALVDLGIPLDAIQEGVSSLGLPECRLVNTEVKRHGFRATKIDVEYPPEHAHRHLHHITEMIDGSSITDAQKELAKRIFTKLGEAEAHVHGTTIRKVHFHEVGAVDSIADIVGAAIGIDLLGIDQIHCSAVPTGHGRIKIAHGDVSIPAPATAELLKGVPLESLDINCELTTPTGAAIVATVVDEFGPLPSFEIEKIGYGAGTKELDSQANVLRMLVGQSEEPMHSDRIWVLETNIDDVSGELLGHCMTQLGEIGALDVYCTPIQMKKNRPAVKLSVLCGAADIQKIEKVVFRETGTLGIRRWPASRHKLHRSAHSVETELGTIEGKLATMSDGTQSFAPEFESCKKISEAKQLPLRDVYQAAHVAFQKGRD